MDRTNPNWVGAWWLGFIICACLYVIVGLPLCLFPRDLREELSEIMPSGIELQPLSHAANSQPHHDPTMVVQCSSFLAQLKALPRSVIKLLKNPVYTSMMLGWIFGAYLVGGYGTYLPKYLERQYHITETMADIYSGIISIGSVAVSTAIGGYLLTKYNISPARSILYLIIAWTVIVITYLIGMFLGCKEANLDGIYSEETKWNFTTLCNTACGCENVVQFDPVCFAGKTYFSPCHAGCSYDYDSERWVRCQCANMISVSIGFCPQNCITMPIYITVMFLGLFLGNLFFMTTMMIILRCVEDEQKSLALSVSSCATNIFGFIPSPLIFGWIIDSSCSVWHARCPQASGNCIVYDNADFRHKYHLGNAIFQGLAVCSVLFTFIKSRTFKFPEDSDVYSLDTPDPRS